VQFCKNVDPADAQQLVCLQQHSEAAGFPAECHAILSNLRARATTRFHLNPRLKVACASDVDKARHLRACAASLSASVLSAASAGLSPELCVVCTRGGRKATAMPR